MPNWVYNEVEIAAPLSEVQAYLFETDDPESTTGGKTHYFNLRQLFPERYDIGDERGMKAWDYDWMVEYLGTKWNPRIDCIIEVEGGTHLGFDTAWSAPENLLRRLHDLTGWKIVNHYDEEDGDHDVVFTCEEGSCELELLPGTSTCSNCEDRWPCDDIDLEHGECPSCMIGRADYLVTIEVDGVACLNIGERGSADLHGDVSLGVFSGRSAKQAMILACCREVPSEAREGFNWYEDPESFGLKAYRLAASDEEGG